MSGYYTWYLTPVSRDDQNDPTWDVDGASIEVVVWFGTQAEYNAMSPPPSATVSIIDGVSNKFPTGDKLVNGDELRIALEAATSLALDVSDNAGYLGTYDVNLDSDPAMEATALFAVDGLSAESSTSAYIITLQPVTLTSFEAHYQGGLGHFDPFNPGSLRPPCFAGGTLIRTLSGERPVEALQPGDLVVTADHGAQPLRVVLSTTLGPGRLIADPSLRPIRIAAGALGQGTPRRDLLVSPQHRVLVRSRIAERMFGSPEVLVAAKHLLGLPGIAVAEDVASVSYYHLVMDAHEVVESEGALTESFYPGPEGLKTLTAAARAEIMALFPGLAGDNVVDIAAARCLSNGRMARKLAARHASKQRALFA